MLILMTTAVSLRCGCDASETGRVTRAAAVAAAAQSSDGTRCAARRSCAQCTAKAPGQACQWSFAEQSCSDRTTGEPGQEQTNGDRRTTMVYETESCPKFSILYNRRVSRQNLYHRITMNVTNDPTGAYAARLKSDRITCHLDGLVFRGRMVDGGEGGGQDGGEDGGGGGHRMECQTSQNVTAGDATDALQWYGVVMYFRVMVGDGVQLQFDNIRDHYLTGYDRKCYDDRHVDAGCVSCFWDDEADGPYRYFCRWCSPYYRCVGGQHEHCDVRRLSDYGHVDGVRNVRVRCPKVRIESVDPLYGPRSGGTNVRIAIAAPIALSVNKAIAVTVAGTACLVHTASEDHVNGTTEVTCTVSPADPNLPTNHSGPVEVTYSSVDEEDDRASITLRSEQTFLFVGDDDNGMASGGVQCRAIDQPTVDGGQKLGGLYSGGTRVYVRGRNFRCMDSPQMYVVLDGVQHTGVCLVYNDTCIVCRSPALIHQRPDGQQHRSVVALPFGFRADRVVGGVRAGPLALGPPPGSPGYLVYPDPVFVDFETADGGLTVTINGLHLDQGYQLSDDLSVKLSDSATAVSYCNVASVGPRHVICRSAAAANTANAAFVAAHDRILVTVGDSLSYAVKRRSPSHGTSRRYSPFHVTAYLGTITLVTATVTVLLAIVYGIKTYLMTSRQPSEIHSLRQLLDSSSSEATTSTVTAVHRDGGADNTDALLR